MGDIGKLLVRENTIITIKINNLFYYTPNHGVEYTPDQGPDPLIPIRTLAQRSPTSLATCDLGAVKEADRTKALKPRACQSAQERLDPRQGPSDRATPPVSCFFICVLLF